MSTAPKIESSDLSIEQVYKDFYVVPDYQREYVWSEDNVLQFAEDIYDEFYGPRGDLIPEVEYFIGSIVACRNESGVFELIDGQQRMTTIYLFLCAIRDFILDNGGDLLRVLEAMIFDHRLSTGGEDVRDHRLTLQYEDSHGILAKVADRDAGFDRSRQPTESMECIADAYRNMRQFLSERFGSDPMLARKFFAAFVQRVKLIRIVTPNLSHALKVFETVNDRGIGLNAMDLLKNLLFMRTTAADFPKLKELWKTLTSELEKCKEKPLRFLRYFIMASFSNFRTGTGKPVREDEIYDWFVRNADELGLSRQPLDFARGLVQAAKDYSALAGGNAPNGTPIVFLDNIQYLSGKARQHFILMLAGRHLPADALNELAKQVESLFFTYVVTREPTKNFEWMFGDWAADVRQAQTREDVMRVVAERIKPIVLSKSRDFDFAMKELSADRIQKYRMKYVLAKLAQHLDQLGWQDAENTRDLSHYLDKKLEIEHILPQQPGAAQLAAFDDQGDYSTWLGRLGNLTLLEKNLNSAVSNAGFDTKRHAYAKSRLVMTRAISSQDGFGKNNSLTRALQALSKYEQWTGTEIQHRQDALAQLARSVWLIDEPEPVVA
ncbi:MAG TPA: DUF262 domain-containing HNH endonuclease family protein [Xanthomonadaceae bacterium]